ncbi:MAG TPA: type IV pilus twitching motility protein PilT [Candidatus Paceibacterota bacterium]|nr:type IV pilus twitching motility protein PilT [Candidatus Paceibacterota bacterium]
MVDYKKELEDLMLYVIREGGSDLHLSVGKTPHIRVSGSLVPLMRKTPLTHEDTMEFVSLLLDDEKKQQFLREQEIDFSYSFSDDARFRCNAFFQSGDVGIAMRLIPEHIRNVTELNLPPILETFSQKKQGFFLVVGPIGQGKSTTLAALINMINVTRSVHILTIEDPIEYIFKEDKAIIDQREVHTDTDSFPAALRSMFRQDVDVLMIGEMRSQETISSAVTAAETGHLVFSTLHTNTAAQTVDRIVDSFPSDQQNQIRMQLASGLIGVFSQRLIPRVGGGMVPAGELMVNTSAVSNLIREGRSHEIPSVIETGSEFGMIDMNRSLLDLVQSGEISYEDAILNSQNPRGLERLL